MTFLGKNIRLKGKTQKGKNRVREHGEFWSVFAETDHVLFRQDMVGPWIFISPQGKDQTHKASRWIHATTDIDFEVFLQ